MVKKFIILFFACIISVMFYNFYLTSAIENVDEPNIETRGSLKEGIYKVEYDKPDFRGWKAFLVLKINSNGKMDEITYDYVNNSGILKTKDALYNKNMKAKTGLGPSEYCPRLAKNLLVYQNPDELDSITGATHSAHTFKEFAQAAYKNAQTGNTALVYITQPEPVNPELLKPVKEVAKQ